MEVPKGHQAIMPYLILEGAARFIEFTQKVFNAELTHRIDREDEDKIKHAELTINGCTIMFADSLDKWKPATANLFIYVDNADTSFEMAKTLGATELMGLSDQEYGRTCGVTDPFGNVWWITSIKK